MDLPEIFVYLSTELHEVETLLLSVFITGYNFSTRYLLILNKEYINMIVHIKIKSALFLMAFHIVSLCSLFAHNVVNFYYPSTQSNIPSQLTSHYLSSYSNREHFNECRRIQSLSWDEIKCLCESKSNDQLFNNFSYYANPYYLLIIRGKAGYEDFILNLRKKIKSNRKYKDELQYVKGFVNIGDFLTLIKDEAAQIKIAQQEHERLALENKRLRTDNSLALQELAQEYAHKASEAEVRNDVILSKRYQQRVAALQNTLKNPTATYDYSNHIASYPQWHDPDADVFNHHYGTAIDQQLHEELSETRIKALKLQSHYPDNLHMQIITPAIYRFTAQAKTERDASNAFSLSDFADALTNVVSEMLIATLHFSDALGREQARQDGALGAAFSKHVETSVKTASALGRGTLSGAKTVLSPEHWKNMATGTINLALHFSDAIGQEETRQNAVLGAAFSKDYDAIPKIGQEYRLYTQAQKDAINRCAQETYQKLKAMPWEKLLENGAELGITTILDTLALNALNGFANATCRAAIRQLNKAMENGIFLTEQYAVEVAGVGKLIIEDGPIALKNIINSIESESADNIALYPKLKESLAIKQITSITNTTKHGAERLLERGFTPSEIIALKNHPDIIMTQSDGANVLITNFNGKYNIIVEGENGVITSLKNISQKSFDRLAENYNWKKK